MRTLLLATLLVVAPGWVSSGHAQSSDPSLAHARVAMRAGHHDEARAELESAARADDADVDAIADAWADLGDLLFLRSDARAAIAAYATAILLAPSVPSYHVARGWALDAVRDFDHVELEIAAARRLDPGNADARALERRLDDARRTRLILFVTGGVTIAVGAILAVVGGLLHGLAPETFATSAGPDNTASDWLIGVGLAVAVLGIPILILGETLRVGSVELPRRGPPATAPTVAVRLGGGWLGVSGSF